MGECMFVGEWASAVRAASLSAGLGRYGLDDSATTPPTTPPPVVRIESDELKRSSTPASASVPQRSPRLDVGDLALGSVVALPRHQAAPGGNEPYPLDPHATESSSGEETEDEDEDGEAPEDSMLLRVHARLEVSGAVNTLGARAVNTAILG